MTREKKMDGGKDRRGEERRGGTEFNKLCYYFPVFTFFYPSVQIFKLAKIVTQVVPSSLTSTSTNSPIAFI